MLLGCWSSTVASEVQIDLCTGFYQGTLTAGGARNVFSGDTKLNTTLLSSADHGRLRLASLHVRIQSTVPNTGFLPSGFLHVGSYSQVIDAATFPSAADLATHIKTRSGTRIWTAAQALNGIDIVLVPNDMVSNQQLALLGDTSTTGAALYPYDGWGTIGVVATGSAGTNTSYLVTVHSRWSVEFTRDIFKQSTHTIHPALQDSEWGRVKSALDAAGGVVEEAVQSGARALSTAAGQAAGQRILAMIGGGSSAPPNPVPVALVARGSRQAPSGALPSGRRPRRRRQPAAMSRRTPNSRKARSRRW